MSKPIGPQFDYDPTGTSGDVTLYSVYIRHPDGSGRTRTFGRVWEPVKGHGWAASPVLRDDPTVDTHDAEINRSVRLFARRKDAAVFLWGFYHGQGRMIIAERYAGTALAPVTAQD